MSDSSDPQLDEGSQRPQKRARSETVTSSQVTEVAIDASVVLPSNATHDEEFWFQDGNVVLLASDTVAFRVYSGLLASQSPVLRNMLSSPAIASAAQIDAVRVVQVLDSSHEWKHLLRILLPKDSKMIPKLSHNIRSDFHAISTVLRLAHKYEIIFVEQYAISALKDMYPDAYERFFEVYYGSFSTTPQDRSTSEHKVTLSYAIGAINLARLTNTLSILPAAFYHCSALGGDIAKGHSREDGTVDYLSRDDLSRCIEGMRTLMTATHEYVQSLSKGPSPSCTKACGQSWRSSLDRLQRHWLVLMRNDPLRGALDHGVFGTERPLCTTCVSWVRGRERDELTKLWNSLPKIFGVDDTGSLLGKKEKRTKKRSSDFEKSIYNPRVF
ncbi:hypothetical protein C8Q74DRAFT_1373699 [Fomes fomentarius]|nr:hypothetical protein C8Q74DRAFT_1373699 [Fomes fomentarius]